jgi:hypothetical protein
MPVLLLFSLHTLGGQDDAFASGEGNDKSSGKRQFSMFQAWFRSLTVRGIPFAEMEGWRSSLKSNLAELIANFLKL